ncbi:MAG: hypothetical protein CL916_09960 [Deltaproteobacteria bacterium]|nr:hypothetical protein [Deltaproteobacteria bacterium]
MIRKRLRRMLSKCIDDLVPDISQPPVFPEYIHRNTKIIDALESSKRAKEIFAKRNLPACELCPLRMEETLGEAAKNYGIDEEEWIIELNFAIFCRLQEMFKVS